jgi:cytochrome c-type biogenesis protein CcmH
MIRLLAAAAVLLAFAAPALASEQHPTLNELEGEVMCPTCHTTLDMSDSLVADRIRDFIRQRIAAGETKSEIKQELVAEFGPAILAEPPKHGFGLLAWLLPLVGIVAGAGALGYGAWLWSRNRGEAEAPVPAVPVLGSEDDRRVDEALARFDG